MSKSKGSPVIPASPSVIPAKAGIYPGIRNGECGNSTSSSRRAKRRGNPGGTGGGAVTFPYYHSDESRNPEGAAEGRNL